MATRVFDGIKFCEQFLKRTSQGTFLPSLVQIGPAIWEEEMFKEIVDDAQRMTDDGHLRATDLSLHAIARHQIACCMRYSVIRKVQSFKVQSRKVVLSLKSFTEKVFLLNLLISITNADRALVSAASNYSMIKHWPINPLRYRNN